MQTSCEVRMAFDDTEIDRDVQRVPGAMGMVRALMRDPGGIGGSCERFVMLARAT